MVDKILATLSVLALAAFTGIVVFFVAELDLALVVIDVIWVRNLFGFVAMLLIGAALAAFARFGTQAVRIVMAQLLAIQLALSAWSTRDYLFVSTFERNGTQRSDTQKIADELFLPHWFWGGLIGGLSIVALVWAFWVAWLRPMTDRL